MWTLTILFVWNWHLTVDNMTEEKHFELQRTIEDTQYNSIIFWANDTTTITINKANIVYLEYKKDLD